VVRVMAEEAGGGNGTNNEAYGVVLVAKEQVFLPLVSRERD
jgi:hypothetical protein